MKYDIPSFDTSFLRIGSDWTPTQALNVLQAVHPARAVVQHEVPGADALFYTFEYDELILRLADKPEMPLYRVLKLRGLPSFEPPAIVMDLGVLRGLPAVTASAGPDATRRGIRTAAAESSSARAGEAPAGAEPRGLHAAAPSNAAVGEEFVFRAWVSRDVSAPGTLPVMVSVGDTIDLLLQAAPPLSILDAPEGTITIGEAAETEPLRFRVVGTTVGQGRITAYAFKDGQSVGHVRLAVSVTAQAAAAHQEEATNPIETPVDLPDLALYVFEDRAKRSYTMRLRATDEDLGINMLKFGPIELRQNPERFFRDFYRDIASILVSAARADAKIAQLSAKGTYLFEHIVPEPLRTQLWQLRGRIGSMQIQSEEPWIPWELVKLSHRDPAGFASEAGFLCEEFEVTRWLLELRQHTALSMKAIGLVVPSDAALRAADVEADDVAALADEQRTVTPIPPKAAELRLALASASYDALHFTGHGSAFAGNADRSEISLEDGQRFRPEDLTGIVANLGRKRPLVFLNACEMGRAGAGLVGMAGWASGFLKAGASAFIGPYWAISDPSAALFSRTFYAQLLKHGATAGAAARAARLEIKKATDPTWLAYAVYAHPDARVA